ncbi:MAG: glycosyltransferase family 4 protein [Candidatus Nealsonbacteria bacterium]|nr:glycosyltransferase family 4 protein [Candidatus Nealsonbacteria bacterium]
MKILMPVLHYYPVIGGLETWTQNIAEGLSNKAEFFVVTGKVSGQPREELRNGVRIIRTSSYSLKNLSYSSPFYILTTLPFIFFASLFLIKKEKIQILHCQGFLSSFLGCLLSKIANIHYIITVQRLEENKGFLRKLVYRNAMVCIAASHAIKEYFEELGCKDVEVIPNGIDLARFKNLDRQRSRNKLGLKDEFAVMTVARLEKIKGLEYLIGAAKIISKNPPNQHKPVFIIIGDGSERKNLEGLAEKLGVEDRVKFLGPIANERIPEYLAGADCFVLPSLKEGFGIAILEAMAAGVPVVATNVGGIKDIIEGGKTGILVEPENSEALAKVISKTCSSGELIGQLVNNAMGELTHYSWNNVLEKVYKIYQKISQ